MRRALILIPLVLGLAAPAWAVKEWYDYYLEARDRHIKAGRWAQAIEALHEAVKLKDTPEVNARTYGVYFEDYLPYYHLGLCYLRTGDLNSAERYLNIEEARGAIRRTSLYRDLLKLRTEIADQRRQDAARRAREEVDRLLKEAGELARTRKYDDALARLAQAQQAAAILDPATQQRVLDLRERVRGDQREQSDAADRQRRIEQAIQDGVRLLEDGRPTEAAVRFDEALALEPRNARATEGKREAQERILASTTRHKLQARFEEGKALFQAGKYQEALEPLSDAAADPANAAARGLLEQARTVVEGIRRQKELKIRIDALLAEAERLVGDAKAAEAAVRLKELLELDPENVRAKERLAHAERLIGDLLFARFYPNQPPLIVLFEPRGLEVEGASVAVLGVATDDRGVAKLQFRLGGRIVAEQVPPPQPDLAAQRSYRFEREFPVEPGLNEIAVTAVDNLGSANTETLRVNRRLRFYETRAFLPSALAGSLGLVGAGFAVQRARRRRAVRKRFNPYIAGAPVLDDEMFFGREKLMARIMNVLHHNSLMITGERRIGKTTFLYHLKKALSVDEATDYKFFPVFTDLQGVPESGFFHAVMTDVVEALRLSPATLAAVRFKPEDGAYDGRDFSHDVQRVIEELKGRTPKRVKLALLIDEVDVLNAYSERINQRLRSIFMKTFSEQLVAIMSGVGIKRTWKSEGSPWYNFFDEIELTALSREDAEALIKEPVGGVFRYQPEAAELILETSGGKPYVIQKYCIHALNRMLEEGRDVVKVEDVIAVRDTVRFERDEEAGEADATQRAPA